MNVKVIFENRGDSNYHIVNYLVGRWGQSNVCVPPATRWHGFTSSWVRTQDEISSAIEEYPGEYVITSCLTEGECVLSFERNWNKGNTPLVLRASLQLA
jgi:hypothetical protein